MTWGKLIQPVSSSSFTTPLLGSSLPILSGASLVELKAGELRGTGATGAVQNSHVWPGVAQTSLLPKSTSGHLHMVNTTSRFVCLFPLKQ